MIHIRTLRPRDWEAACSLLNQSTASLPYHWPLIPAEFQLLMLSDPGAPHLKLRLDPAGWLVAVEGPRLLGMMQVVISGAYLDLTPPQGCLRLLVLAPDAPLAAAKGLLRAADRYFRQHEVREITAFAPETGFACVLAGRGWLPGDRLDLLRAMGEAGYQLRDRWLMYEKHLARPSPEILPRLTDLRLNWRSAETEQIEFWLHHEHAAVAHIHLKAQTLLSQRTQALTASLDYFFVSEVHRRQGLGRWLLQRALNELFARQYMRLLMHINHQDAAMQSLLLQLGFDELPLRGYTYEKDLHES